MKLQKTTWLLVIVAILLGGTVAFLETQNRTEQQQERVEQKQLFNIVEQDIQTLMIKTQKTSLQFDRTNEPNRTWQMTRPEKATANEATIAFLLNLLVKSQSDREFNIAPDRLKEYGLNKPLATLEIRLKNGQRQQLILGNPNFGGESLYAQIGATPQADGTIKIAVVSKNFQYAIERDLKEWKTEK